MPNKTWNLNFRARLISKIPPGQKKEDKERRMNKKKKKKE